MGTHLQAMLDQETPAESLLRLPLVYILQRVCLVTCTPRSCRPSSRFSASACRQKQQVAGVILQGSIALPAGSLRASGSPTRTTIIQLVTNLRFCASLMLNRLPLLLCCFSYADRFPEGEWQSYKDDNLWRETSAEKRELQRLQADMINDVRQAAEVHRQVRNTTQSRTYRFQDLRPAGCCSMCVLQLGCISAAARQFVASALPRVQLWLHTCRNLQA